MRQASLTRQQTLYLLHRFGNNSRTVRLAEKFRLGESVLVDVPTGICGGVEVEGVRRKNLLTANFACLLYGILAEANYGPVIDAFGVTCTLRTSGDVNAGAFSIGVGSWPTPPTMSDYTLGELTWLTTTRSLAFFDTESQVVGTASSTRSFVEVGIGQVLVDTGGTSRTILLGRALMSGGVGTPIVYRVRFMAPWLRNLATLMFGIMTESNQPVIAVDGTTFTSRSSGDVNAGHVTVVGSESTVSWSPTLINIPSPYSLTTSSGFVNPRVHAIWILWGYVIPSATVRLGTLAIYQSLYDTTGYTRTAALAVIPLPSPVDLPANRMSIVFLRFVMV